MMPHKDEIRLRHMLDHAREAVDMIKGKREKDLKNERMLELALVRLIEIVGEASARISPEEQEKWPSIPWQHVIGMRNRLIHGYDSVDIKILWNTLDEDLPKLIRALEKILRAS